MAVVSGIMAGKVELCGIVEVFCLGESAESVCVCLCVRLMTLCGAFPSLSLLRSSSSPFMFVVLRWECCVCEVIPLVRFSHLAPLFVSLHS